MAERKLWRYFSASTCYQVFLSGKCHPLTLHQGRLNRRVLELSGAYEWNFSPNDTGVNIVLLFWRLPAWCSPKDGKIYH